MFAQLHTFIQFDFDTPDADAHDADSQSRLLDRLLFHTSRPLASRVVGRSHLEALALDDMHGYLVHHLRLADTRDGAELPRDQAVMAVHQGSGGLLRRANHLARGALMAAAREGCALVSAEHVRLASAEIL